MGILSDKVSSRFLFAVGLVGASLSVVGFAYVDNVTLYAILWFMNGLAQGCGWPACAKLLQRWYRPDQFGTFWSILASSTNVSGGVVPLFLPFFLSGIGSWRSFMLISGLTSLAWSVVSVVFVRNCPEDGMNLRRNPRMKVIFIYTVLCIVLLHLITIFSVMLPLLGFLLGAALYGNINIFGIVAVECAPAYLGGSSHAVVALASYLGAVIAGLPLSLIAGRFGWSGVFRLMGASCILCSLTMFFGRNVSTQIAGEKKKD